MGEVAFNEEGRAPAEEAAAAGQNELAEYRLARYELWRSDAAGE